MARSAEFTDGLLDPLIDKSGPQVTDFSNLHVTPGSSPPDMGFSSPHNTSTNADNVKYYG